MDCTQIIVPQNDAGWRVWPGTARSNDGCAEKYAGGDPRGRRTGTRARMDDR